MSDCTAECRLEQQSSPVCGNCCTRISNLSVHYGQSTAVDSVNLHFHCGELTALAGPNGGGKSSLLKAVLGDIPYTGEVRFRHGSGTQAMPSIGYVPQSLAVPRDTPVSVIDFLLLSLQRTPVWVTRTRKALASAREALERVSADHLKERKLGDLSGGEFQKVMLARAMNPLPEILLLDEPVSGVDVRGLTQFYETICGLRRRFDVSIILVTHDIAAIAPHADRMIVLNKTILADGPPQKLLSDAAVLDVLGRPVLPASRVPDDSEYHGVTR